MERSVRLSGNLSGQVRGPRPVVNTVAEALAHGQSLRNQPAHVRDWKQANRPHLARGLRDLANAQRYRIPALLGMLWARIQRPDGPSTDLGLVSCRVVTTAGVAFVVDAWQNLVELENMRFHGMGTGTAAEATTDTALGAELTTQYVTNSTRVQGSVAEAAANVFRSVANVGVDAASSVTEWGLFSQAAVPGGVMFDRAVFAAMNLQANESIEWTWDCTMPAGG